MLAINYALLCKFCILSREMESIQTKMESMRLMWEKEASLEKQFVDSSSLQLLDSVKANPEETVRIQGEELKVKSRLKEAEDELFKALSVKTRKEAKRMAALDAISAVKARVEEVDKKARWDDEYSSIISRQSLALAALEEKIEVESSRKRVEIQEASARYNKMLGLHVEAGRGVKFSFSNIDAERPDKLYTFTIRHVNEVYSLLECDPPVDCIQELMHDLNKSNDLFKFVRIMRRRFVEATQQGTSRAVPQASSTVGVSVPSFSSDTNESENKGVERNGTPPRSSSSIRRRSRRKMT